MTTTTLSIDKDIRDLAAIRAKADKMSVSVVARMLLRDYAQGKISIGSTFSSPETYRTEFIKVDDEIQNTMNEIGVLWDSKRTNL
jgi:hypothetical protein